MAFLLWSYMLLGVGLGAAAWWSEARRDPSWTPCTKRVVGDEIQAFWAVLVLVSVLAFVPAAMNAPRANLTPGLRNVAFLSFGVLLLGGHFALRAWWHARCTRVWLQLSGSQLLVRGEGHVRLLALVPGTVVAMQRTLRRAGCFRHYRIAHEGGVFELLVPLGLWEAAGHRDTSEPWPKAWDAVVIADAARWHVALEPFVAAVPQQG